MLVRPHIQIMVTAIDCRWDREFSCACASPTPWPSASSPHLSFSTYRRHRDLAVAQITDWMWEREVYGHQMDTG
jgi:hypothetical protein